jgi:methyl-accepting chemotaxis protein
MPNRRSKYFIDKDFQLFFIVKFCSLIVAGSIFVVGVMYFLGRQSTTVSIVGSRVVVLRTTDFLLPLLMQTALAVTAISAVFTIIFTLLFSHKIAGPLYRFRQAIIAVKNGDFTGSFRLRDYDQLQDLALDLQAAVDGTRQKINDIKSRVNEIKNCNVGELKENIDELEKRVDQFKS